MTNTSQRPDIVQWYNKTTGRYLKIQRATGETLAEKVTIGPYKNIHVAKRRPRVDEEAIAKDAVNKVPKKPKKPRKVNYLNNKDLMIEIHKSKAADPPMMTNKLAHMLQTLAARYGKKSNFVGYSYNDDMQAFAMMMLVRTWQRFDPTKSENPFAFFTQCIKNSFIQFLNQESKHRTVRDTLMVNSGLDPSYAFQEKYQQKQLDARVASDDVDSAAGFKLESSD